MLTQSKIAADIENIATSGSLPTDYRIERAQILFWIDEIRAVLIAQDIGKRKDISDTWIQPITCLNLIEVDKSECCEVTTDCKIIRTELTIPSTIETNSDNSIVRITDNLGNIISRTNVFEVNYNEYSKYSKNNTKWYFKNDYIYVLINDLEEVTIESINVYGIWESPSELRNYISCGGNTCFDANTTYPCSFKMANDITNIILKTKIYPFIQLPQDTTNDNSDRFNNTPPNNLK